jgi:hypothetical protein
MKHNETVTIRLPAPVAGESKYQYAAINGMAYIIQKGVEVEVPRCVAQLLVKAEEIGLKARSKLTPKGKEGCD